MEKLLPTHTQMISSNPFMQMNLAPRMSNPSQSVSEPSFTKKMDSNWLVKCSQKIGFDIRTAHAWSQVHLHKLH